MSLLQSDVVIVGNELSGVAAGALLAHEGLKVAWIGEDPCKSVPIGGFSAPKQMDLWQLNTQQTQQDIFRDLSLRQEVRRELKGPEAFGIIGDPQERLWMSPDPQARVKELKRAFGPDAEQILQKLTNWPKTSLHLWLNESTHLHQKGFWAKRKRNKRLQGSRPDVGENILFSSGMGSIGLRFLLDHIRPFVQWTDHEVWTSLGQVEAARTLLEGVYLPRSPHMSCRDSLIRTLIQFIKRRGGSVHPNVQVKRVEAQGKKIRLLHTNSNHEFGARIFIDATINRSFASKIDNVPLATLLHSEEDAVPQNRDAAVIRWLLPKEVLPRGLPARSIHVLDRDGPLKTVIVGVYDRLEGITPDNGKNHLAKRFAVVMAQSTCPLDRAAHTAVELEVFLDQFLPFAKSRVVSQDVLIPKKIGPIAPAYALNEKNWPFMGRAIQTGIRNCLRSGRDLAPGLGMNGELHTAYAICNLVAKKAGPKKSLFREPPPT